MSGGLVVLLSVFGRMRPFEFGFCLGLDGRILYLPGLAVGSFESLAALRGLFI